VEKLIYNVPTSSRDNKDTPTKELQRVVREKIDEDSEMLEREGKAAERSKKHSDRWTKWQRDEQLVTDLVAFNGAVYPVLQRGIEVVVYGENEAKNKRRVSMRNDWTSIHK
jgi:hypothetical protein